LEIIKDLDIEVFDGVYKPSDDTYLLLGMITLDGDESVLEIGSGTGIISIHCQIQGADTLSVDIDEKALDNTELNAENNNIHLSVKKSDLFSRITKDDWDVIIFNPPYLPEEKLTSKDRRWDGGKKGDEIIIDFLEKADGYLSEDGELYFCYSSLAPEDKIKDLVEQKYRVLEIQKRRFFYETLYGVKLIKYD